MYIQYYTIEFHAAISGWKKVSPLEYTCRVNFTQFLLIGYWQPLQHIHTFILYKIYIYIAAVCVRGASVVLFSVFFFLFFSSLNPKQWTVVFFTSYFSTALKPLTAHQITKTVRKKFRNFIEIDNIRTYTYYSRYINIRTRRAWVM